MVSDIPAGDGENDNVFLKCGVGVREEFVSIFPGRQTHFV
jgi:hypothetical protein